MVKWLAERTLRIGSPNTFCKHTASMQIAFKTGSDGTALTINGVEMQSSRVEAAAAAQTTPPCQGGGQDCGPRWADLEDSMDGLVCQTGQLRDLHHSEQDLHVLVVAQGKQLRACQLHVN